MNNVIAKQASIELYREVAKTQAISAAKILVVGGAIAYGLNKLDCPTAGGLVGGFTGVLAASSAIGSCRAMLASDAEIDATAQMIAELM